MLVFVPETDVTAFVVTSCEFTEVSDLDMTFIAATTAVFKGSVTETASTLIMSWAGTGLTIWMADWVGSQITWATVCTSVDTGWVALLAFFVNTGGW